MTLPADLHRRRLGVDAGTFEVAGPEETEMAAIALLRQGRRHVEILTRDMRDVVFATSGFIAAAKEMALYGPVSRIRILIQDPGTVAMEGHPLLELARRLPSRIALRRPAEEHRDQDAPFLLVDGAGLLHRPPGKRRRARTDFHAPAEVRRLARHFDEIWEQGLEPADLRRLYL